MRAKGIYYRVEEETARDWWSNLSAFAEALPGLVDGDRAKLARSQRLPGVISTRNHSIGSQHRMTFGDKQTRASLFMLLRQYVGALLAHTHTNLYIA